MDLNLSQFDVPALLELATEMFPEMGLKPRSLKSTDLKKIIRYGDHDMCFIRAFPKKSPDTHVVLIAKQDELDGVFLYNANATVHEPRLECPELDIDTKAELFDVIDAIDAMTPTLPDPFFILSWTDGTYLQAYCGDDGFEIEHQLVNVTNHHGLTTPVDRDDAVKIFTAYLNGDDSWWSDWAWERMELL